MPGVYISHYTLVSLYKMLCVALSVRRGGAVSVRGEVMYATVLCVGRGGVVSVRGEVM